MRFLQQGRFFTLGLRSRHSLICSQSMRFSSGSSVGNRPTNVTVASFKTDHVVFDLRNMESCRLLISSAWQDHCEVSCLPARSSIQKLGGAILQLQNLDIHCDNEAGYATISIPEIAGNSGGGMNVLRDIGGGISARVPENIHISIVANNLVLEMKNKIQGDVFVEASSGRIVLDKVRGDSVNINAGEASVHVKKALEGNIAVCASDFSAKLIHGDNVVLRPCATVTIGAMYAQNCTIASSAAGGVQCGLVRGHIKVEALEGNVSLKGVDGTIDVTAHCGNIDLQINKLSSSNFSSGSSLCRAVAFKGSTTAVLDAEISGRVLLLWQEQGKGQQQQQQQHDISKSSSFKAMNTSTEQTAAIINTYGNLNTNSAGQTVKFIAGHLLPAVPGSRFHADGTSDLKKRSSHQSGKINLSQAASQAMHTVNPESKRDVLKEATSSSFFSLRDGKNDGKAAPAAAAALVGVNRSMDRSINDSHNSSESTRGFDILLSGQRVNVHRSSWMEIIRQKYFGTEEGNDNDIN